MSISQYIHLEYGEAKFSVDDPENQGGDAYFHFQIQTMEGDHYDTVGFFMRPDQLAELFYALRDADTKFLDPCVVCDGTGKTAGDEPGTSIPCRPCRGSGAMLKVQP